MYCPQCGQERISQETSFCSKCGYLLTGTAELLQTGGLIPTGGTKSGGSSSPRSRGLKQGLFIFLLTFLVVPIIAIISRALDLQPWAVAISSIVLFVGGLLRMAYAVMFESTIPGAPTLEENAIRGLHGRMPVNALPPQQSVPVSSYVSPAAGKWRDTNDLQPTSVTEKTTNLLEKDQ
jgi:hypothetical protein